MGSPNHPTGDNPVELVEEAVATKLIADELYGRHKDLSTRAAAILGRSTLYPALPDGTELACFTVPAGTTTVTVTDEAKLIAWMREHYPTEVETVTVVRPAFLEKLRQSCRDACAPVAPDGETDVPGITVTPASGPGTPRVKPTDEGRERARSAVAAVLDRTLAQFATAALEEVAK